VTSLFPLYDFARAVGGEKARVVLLLPPGVEPHSFEPTPRDILEVNRADIFVYTGSSMEPWAVSIIEGADRRKLVVVDSSRGVAFQREQKGAPSEDEPSAGPEAGNSRKELMDPHIWLDLDNAQKMVDNILAGFIEKDPVDKGFFEQNAALYKSRLRRLDEQFRESLGQCKTRLFVHGGHYAFNYLAKRYALTYVSAYGFSPDAEPSPKHLSDMIQVIRRHNTKYIFYEELIQPRVAETLSRETGAKLLALNGGHNVTAEEMKRGVTFISLLEQDLQNLKVGLQCQ
jgi:zinc transport system substrate-binding protein